jgi:hypothetical protein
MGPGKYEIVGKSQPVLIMIDPMISTRTRMPSPHCDRARRLPGGGMAVAAAVATRTLVYHASSTHACDLLSGRQDGGKRRSL